MDFAADAVFDVVAPPTRQTPTRAPSRADASEPIFDDHLEAASAEEALPSKETAKVDDRDAEANADTNSPGNDTTAVVTQDAPQPAAAAFASPHIVQIVTATAPEDVAPPEAPAPVELPAPAPATPAPQQNAAPDVRAADVAPMQAPSQAKSDASAKAAPESAPKTNKHVAQNPGAPAQAAQATPQATQPSTIESPAQEATDTAPSSLSIEFSAAVTQPAAPQAQRTGKAQSTRDSKSIEIDTSGTQSASAQTAPQPHQMRVNVNSSEKSGVSLARVETDAPEPALPAPQLNTLAAPALTATHTQTITAVHDTALERAAPAASQVAREIIRRFGGENARFELRLDPPELGRVEVRLDVSRDNRVSAIVSADSPQALAELSRHARDLEAALQSAGLELADAGLSFDLRQGGEGSNETTDSASNARGAAASEDMQQAPPAARPLGYERWRGVRVDVMV